MSDFIREVDEEYRRDRAARFLSRYKVLLAVVAVAIIAGAGLWRFWTDRQLSRAEAANARYDAAVTLAKDGKDAEARMAFSSIANEGPPGYALLARMRAVETQAAHDPDGAAKAFDAIAGDESVSPAMRDLARLRGAFLSVDHEDPKAFEQRYGRFSVAGFAYHDSMRELLALAAIKRQETSAATRYLDEILEDPLAPNALRNRAEAFRALAIAGPAMAGTSAAPQPAVTPLSSAATNTPPAVPRNSATPSARPSATIEPAAPAASPSAAVVPAPAPTAAPLPVPVPPPASVTAKPEPPPASQPD